MYLSSNKATNVSHVTEQERAALIRNRAEPGVVPVPGVRTTTTNDQPGPEIQGLLLQLIVVDIPSIERHLVGQALEVNRGRRDLLPSGGVVPMCEVAAGGEIQAHDAVVGLEHGRVGSEVGRRAGVGLHIDAPLGGVDVEGLEGARPAKVLDLVDELVASVVPVARQALGVLVGEGAAQGLDDGEGGEVLRRDQLDASALAPLLLLDEVVDFWVHRMEGCVSPVAYGIHFGWEERKRGRLKGERKRGERRNAPILVVGIAGSL
jgi:hypothetical protein